MPKNEEVLSAESARTELDRLYEYYEVEIDSKNQDQTEAIEHYEPVILKGLRMGFIEFDETDGFTVIQKLRSGEVLKYKEMNGQAKITMDRKKENENLGKCYALLGSLSGMGENAIKKLKGPDLTRAENIGAMLLLS